MAFTVCIYLLAFCVAISVVIFLGVVAIGLLALLALFCYQLPYICWCGVVDADRKYPSTKDCSIRQSAIYATKLYKHWILGREPEL